VSGQFQALRRFSSGTTEAELAPEPILTLLNREKSLTSVGDVTLIVQFAARCCKDCAIPAPD
jgi:hypothetical protein